MQCISKMSNGSSQTEVSKETGIPRTTLQYWMQRESHLKQFLDPNVVNFFSSESGVCFLHRLFVSLIFMFTKICPCGTPAIKKMLELTGLDCFIASSIGSLHAYSKQMEALINTFGDTEGERLGKIMSHKKITACLDETFFKKDMILVAIEPVSNFILTESIEQSRTAETWDKVMKECLKKLNVTIVQSTGDQGSGLVSYVTKILHINHSPDLFHIQQDITKAVGGLFARKASSAHKKLEKARERKEKAIERSADQNKIMELEQIEKESSNLKMQIDKDLETVRNAKKEIGTIYHPFEIESGAKRNGDQLKKELELEYEKIEEAATRNNCSEKQEKRLQKSKNMISKMKETIQIFFMFILQYIESLNLSEEESETFQDILVPIAYLKSVEKRTRDIKERKKIQTTLNQLHLKLDVRMDWKLLSIDEQQKLRCHAEQCADRFQRSSSCVEGRNGFLSLMYHALHRLSFKKLKSMTVIHNYFITGKHKKTPAEIFFEQKPNDLFDWLLENMDFPLRSRKNFEKVNECGLKKNAA